MIALLAPLYYKEERSSKGTSSPEVTSLSHLPGFTPFQGKSFCKKDIPEYTGHRLCPVVCWDQGEIPDSPNDLCATCKPGIHLPAEGTALQHLSPSRESLERGVRWNLFERDTEAKQWTRPGCFRDSYVHQTDLFRWISVAETRSQCGVQAGFPLPHKIHPLISRCGIP